MSLRVLIYGIRIKVGVLVRSANTANVNTIHANSFVGLCIGWGY
ncbi:hypothetical protein VCRA2123O444_40164 [Vibrio crassostreae]|nr:hypothetical protein VCRA2114O422_40062 [Vibrio crassostreae]CAK2117441.1 hypothetical protein VCRA2119O431_40062 [Vibrio crassostreae]CAK2123461.1 hypothetical protein VCRA2113O409_50064 [Vibrio crassostreae]CAK2124217.1 hypothetical protein VCRA2113O412_50062 [Vibrio crassostreae]CAK2125243.1 hypothetical protein VCRA2113O414_50062 [Vibrio crassostreae]